MKRLLFTAGFILLLRSIPMAGPVEDLIRNSGNAADYPDAAYLVLFDSTRVEVMETGLGYFHTRRLCKVLTASGALDLSVIRYDYDPLSAMAEITEVIIHRSDGSTSRPDLSKVLDYPAPARAIYWGAREVMLEVGRLEAGDAVEIRLFKKGFTYALLQTEDDERFIPPMRGHFYDIVPFWHEQPVLEKVYQVSLPASKQVTYKVYNGNMEVDGKKTGHLQQYTFTARNLMPLKSEPSMADKYDVALKMILTTSPDWESKSTWFFNVNEDYGSFNSTEAIRMKVSEILRGAVNETDSISRLTHWCADEIRYSGISMGKGEGYTLHTGDMTFTDRAGVCKDKAGMLITMLRAAGFESYPAMTMAGSRIENIPADHFNHCVTVVKRKDGRYELLDPTWVPFLRELWSSAEQQQNYLMGLPGGASLMETPVSPPENHWLKMHAVSELSPDGTLNGSITIKAEGQTDAAIRRMFTGQYRSRWKQQIEKELLKIHPAAVLLEYDMQQPYHYTEGPITMEIRFSIPGFAVITEKEIILKNVLTPDFFRNAQAHLNISTALKERKYPFRDRCSRLSGLNETIRLPFRVSTADIPVPEPVNGKRVSWSGSYKVSGNELHMKQDASFGQRIYGPEDWPDFRQAVINQKDMDRWIVLKRL